MNAEALLNNQAFWDALTEIFKRAIASPLGLAGLVVLVAGFVVLALFKPVTARASARILAVVILLLFYITIVGVAFYNVRPVGLPSGSSVAEAESRSHQPLATAAAVVTAPATPAASASSVAQAQVRVDCGTFWTDWFNVGGGVGNPCPPGCTRRERIGVTFRAVHFPPRPQARYKFQCWR
jgi:hypothetical protein